jgi:peptidoglycan/LPS O-acetylase OafA/YrhL
MNEGKRFDVLDSWRGIAACLVALYHLVAHSHLAGVTLLRHSHLFVDFFFVLSGFVIAANYQQRLIEGFGIGRFALLRFGRLYPLHVAMLGLCILGHLAHWISGLGSLALFEPPTRSADTIIANLLLIHSLNVFDFPTWNLPSWSISTEFYTYILYALAIGVMKDRIWRLLVPIVLLSPLALWILVGHMDTTYDYGIIRCVFGFSAGVLVWNLHRAAWLRSGTALELLTIALIVFFVWAAGRTALEIGAPFVFAVAVLVFATEAGAVSSVLRKRVFLTLGALSYSIYMVHYVVARVVMDAAKLLKLTRGDPFSGLELGRELWEGDVAYLVYFALVLCVSAITYRMIEVPGRAWFRRLAGSRPYSEDSRVELQHPVQRQVLPTRQFGDDVTNRQKHL